MAEQEGSPAAITKTGFLAMAARNDRNFMPYSIGVDLGGTNLRIAAVDERGTLLEKVTLGTETQRGREFVISEMTTAIRSVIAKYKDKGDLIGIGIGVPGFIDMDTGTVLDSPNLPGWADYPVHQDIEHRLGAKVVLENDANAAAMGEKWLGAGRDVNELVMFTLGTGVGGGIILGGRVWHGMKGMAGELGHSMVVPDGHPCGCGSHGCLEQYASATAIVRMAKEEVARGMSDAMARASRNDVEFSSKVVYQLAIQGDKAAQEVFNTVGRSLGIAVGNFVNALNFPMYVIGGGVVSAWDAFSPTMFEELRVRSFIYRVTMPDAVKPGDKRTIVTRSLLGSDAGLFGAARLPMLAANDKTAGVPTAGSVR
jgi:glucokinase